MSEYNGSHRSFNNVSLRSFCGSFLLGFGFLLAWSISGLPDRSSNVVHTEEEARQQREAEEVDLDELHEEQLALVRLGRLRSPAQQARLLVVTRRKAVLTLSAKARRKRKKRRQRRTRRSLLMIPPRFSPHLLRALCIWQSCSVSWCCFRCTSDLDSCGS